LALQQGAREADDRRYVDGAAARFREARGLDFLCVAGKSGRRRSRKLHHLMGRVAAVDFASPRRMQPNCAFGWREFRLIY
jgi:hypothetical protein